MKAKSCIDRDGEFPSYLLQYNKTLPKLNGPKQWWFIFSHSSVSDWFQLGSSFALCGVGWDCSLLKAQNCSVQDGSIPWLAEGAGHQVELSRAVRQTSSWALHWIELHIAWWLGSRRRIAAVRTWNLKISLSPGLGNYSITSAASYWSKRITGAVRFKKRNRPGLCGCVCMCVIKDKKKKTKKIS